MVIYIHSLWSNSFRETVVGCAVVAADSSKNKPNLILD